jgi:hypothetical protein
MRSLSTGLTAFSLGCLMALACTYRTALLVGEDERASTGGSPAVHGQAGTGGAGPTGGSSATGGATSTGGSGATSNDRRCERDEDCVQCVYASAPSNPDQCEGALGCCGGPVMNQKACASNEVAWQAKCSGRAYTIPVCPCIIPCSGENRITCRDGKCGYWCD